MSGVIEVDGVTKRFRLHHERYGSLKERVIHFGRIPYEDFWALDGVSFSVGPGETVGLLGHNGSGKSTLLKCIAGILQPTSGSIRTNGRLSALLELGAGFHPDLTGRENVFLNGAILGLSKRDVARRFDEIVAFAELEAFIDNQVKHYSSGMYIRLGFAVAVHTDPDILLVDEVLAVGDEAFQRKCLDRVRRLQREGVTIVFVTHAPDLVRQICDRAVVLDHGGLVADAPAGEAVRVFREHLLSGGGLADADALRGTDAHTDADLTPSGRRRNYKVRITSVEMEHAAQRERAYLLPHEPLTMRVRFEAVERLDDVVFGLAIYDIEGRPLHGVNTEILGARIDLPAGPGEARFDIASVPFLDGTYLVTIGVHDHDGGVVYDWHEQQHTFEVMNPRRVGGMVDLAVSVEVTHESSGDGAAGERGAPSARGST